MTLTAFAQTPQKMSYQAVIRNAANDLFVNQTVVYEVNLVSVSAQSE